MARKRIIDPEIWDDVKFNSLCRDARLLFIGIFNLADDEGRIEGSTQYLRKKILGYDTDITTEQVNNWINEIISKHMVIKYIVDENEYISIPKFKKHQTVSHPSPSKIPPPNGQKSFVELYNIPEDSRDFQNFPEDSGDTIMQQKNTDLNVIPEDSRDFQNFPEDSAYINIRGVKLREININKINNIYTAWNNLGIIVHRKCTDTMKRKIINALKDNTEDEIIQSMRNYAEILYDENYYWTYAWSIDEFLSLGLDKFRDIEIAKRNYKGDKRKNKKQVVYNKDDHAGMIVEK